MASIPSGLTVYGPLQCSSFSPPPSCVVDASVATPSGGAAGIGTSKMNHRQHVKYGQANGAAVTETRPIWITYGTVGLLKAFRAGSIAAAVGAAVVTVDLYKNGATVLSAPITLNSSSAARIAAAATITTTTTAAGDWFDLVITSTPGGGTAPTGVFAEMVIDEYPS